MLSFPASIARYTWVGCLQFLKDLTFRYCLDPFASTLLQYLGSRSCHKITYNNHTIFWSQHYLGHLIISLKLFLYRTWLFYICASILRLSTLPGRHHWHHTFVMYDQMEILALDPDSLIELEYLAEGAANVVYRIRFPPQRPSISADLGQGDTPTSTEKSPLQSDSRLSGKLLRLRKRLPFTVPVIESQKYWESVICPIFAPDNLVQQVLFRPSTTLIKRCNAALHSMERDGTRADKRHQVYLAEGENHGTLITDMTCASTSQHIGIEFKPKWLVQSPSAPAGSVRCRTCALRAMKSSIHPPSHSAKQLKLGFCPLNLVSDDKINVATAASIVLELCRPEERDNELIRRALVDFLYKSPLLRKLRDLQIVKDSVGVLKAELSQRDFLTAMTIRDCTLFLKVSRSVTSPQNFGFHRSVMLF